MIHRIYPEPADEKEAVLIDMARYMGSNRDEHEKFGSTWHNEVNRVREERRLTPEQHAAIDKCEAALNAYRANSAQCHDEAEDLDQRLTNESRPEVMLAWVMLAFIAACFVALVVGRHWIINLIERIAQ